MRATAVIVAAGEGSRLQSTVSKPYVMIAGRPLILHTLDRFAAAQTIAGVVLVVKEQDREQCEAMVRADPQSRALAWTIQPGGATRQESVRRGLQGVAADSDIVVIHDGARPFVPPRLIDLCVTEAHKKAAVVVGLPARDTIKIVSKTREVQATPDRGSLWEIQTPQAFHRQLIVRAHDWAAEKGLYGTDDASLVEWLGKPVYVLDGKRTNIKITVPDDLLIAETLVRQGRIADEKD
jgi:2-C-methyl-D-erythritol 4-phosphate cytidylyltransferase